MKLSRDLIISAALEVVDRDGWDAFSMRRLAQELDVWPMAVYRHFRDKDELLDTIAAAAAERVAIPAKRGSWRSQMRELLSGVRESVERYPGGARSPLTPGGPRTTEAALRILAEGGFDRTAAVRAWRTLYGYTAGFAALLPDADRSDAARRGRAAIAALPAPDYPALAAATDELTAPRDPEDEFNQALECLFDGLETRLAGRGNPEPAR